MKRLWVILPVLLIVGCSKEPINYEEMLNEIGSDGSYITKDTNEPYSGPVFSFLYENRQKGSEGILKDGWKVGKWTYWHENGQKKELTRMGN